ncbi:hypothetical protein MASR1M45_14430 [Candidatus Kapaibacterium sp.]
MKKIITIVAIVLLSASILKSDLGLFEGTISTTAVYNINLDKGTSGGTYEMATDDPDVTTVGIVWHTSTNPTLTTKTGYTSQTPPNARSGSFTSQMSSLVNGNTYYVRAYIINTDGTFYGDEVSFVSIPTLGEWGLIALTVLLAGFGGWFIWRRVA